MTWLSVTIVAYALLGFTHVVNRYLLAGPLPDPKVYVFYVSFLSMLVFLFTPVLGLTVLPLFPMAAALLSGFVFMVGLFVVYAGLHRFEASRFVPAIGGLTPIFTLLGSFIAFSGNGVESTHWLAFLLLIAGSVFITVEREKKITLPSLKFALAAALLLSSSFVLAKYVYLVASFWSPFVWMKAGGFIFALCLFVFSRELRLAIFGKSSRNTAKKSKKTIFIFLGNQVLGAAGNILQNVAFFLVPVLYVSFVNALEGIIYVFVLVFSALGSVFFPHLIRETFTKGAAFQKVAATALILTGILILFLGN
jgi:drug/metabolite transporter (DMT)-like permease